MLTAKKKDPQGKLNTWNNYDAEGALCRQGTSQNILVYPDFQSNSLNNRFLSLLLGLNLPITHNALSSKGHGLARNTVTISLSELQKSQGKQIQYMCFTNLSFICCLSTPSVYYKEAA